MSMDRTENAGVPGEMKTIGEIMVPLEQYPCVRDNTTLREAIDAIESAQIEVRQRKSLPRGLMVYDEIGVFVGFRAKARHHARLGTSISG